MRKLQIPGYQDALRKIKRFMEDEENLFQVIAENHEIPSGEKEGGRGMITKIEEAHVPCVS